MNGFFAINLAVSGLMLVAICIGAYEDAKEFGVDKTHMMAALYAVVWVGTLVLAVAKS